MAVAQLYFHLAPKAEVGVIAKALVRLLRSHRSVAPWLWWCPIPPPQLLEPMGSSKTLSERPPKSPFLEGHQVGGLFGLVQSRHRVTASW